MTRPIGGGSRWAESPTKHSESVNCVSSGSWPPRRNRAATGESGWHWLVDSVSTGGVRTDGQPDATDRTRLEQANALTAEHGAHPLLGPLYRRVHQLMTGIDSEFRDRFADRTPDLE